MTPAPPQPPPPDLRRVLVQLTVGGRKLDLRVEVPTAPIAPASLLPLYRGLADRLTAISMEVAEGKGDKVACRKGCAACCRQVVAVSALEARELVKLVERMPEPQRSRVKERFAQARRRLEAEAPHLIPHLLHPQDTAAAGAGPRSDAELHEFSRAYLRLRIDCPFLEDEACSIYPERPVACRQYAVVSDPQHCATLSPDVRAITPVGGGAQTWMPVAERSPAGRPVEFVALVLAPVFVSEHPADPPPRPGVDLLNEFLARMQQRGKWEQSK